MNNIEKLKIAFDLNGVLIGLEKRENFMRFILKNFKQQGAEIWIISGNSEEKMREVVKGIELSGYVDKYVEKMKIDTDNRPDWIIDDNFAMQYLAKSGALILCS